jgi:hypothetical protein
VIRRGVRPETESPQRSTNIDITVRCLDSDGVPHEMFIPATPDEDYVPGDWRPIQDPSIRDEILSRRMRLP